MSIYGTRRQWIARVRKQESRGKLLPAAVTCPSCLGKSKMCVPCAEASRVWIQTLCALLPRGGDIGPSYSVRALVEATL